MTKAMVELFLPQSPFILTATPWRDHIRGNQYGLLLSCAVGPAARAPPRLPRCAEDDDWGRRTSDEAESGFGVATGRDLADKMETDRVASGREGVVGGGEKTGEEEWAERPGRLGGSAGAGPVQW